MSGNQERNHFVLSSFGEYNINPACHVYLPPNLAKSHLLNFPAFKQWLPKLLHNLDLQKHAAHRFHDNKYQLKMIEVQAVDWFGSRLGFVKMQVKVENGDGLALPGAVFLRGGSVGMLIVLQAKENTNTYTKDDDDKYVILTIQPRIAAASLAFAEIPAGMLDGNSFTGTAEKEIWEETKLKVKVEELFALSEPAVSQSTITPWKPNEPAPKENDEVTKEKLHNAMYPSMGACDEYLPLYLCQKRVPAKKLKILMDLATGLSNEGEHIRLKIVGLHELCIEGGRDGKALAAYALYKWHQRQGTEGIKTFYDDDLEDLECPSHD